MIHPYAHNPNFKRLLRLEKRSGVIKYTIAGIIIWSSDFIVFYLLLRQFNFDLVVATVGAYICGITVSYLISRYWVFSRDVNGMGQATNLFRYSVMLGINLVLIYLILQGLSSYFSIDPIIGKFYVAFFMYFWTYITNKLWVFKGPSKPRKAAKRRIKKRYA